jgi:hypothetical protein
MPTLLLPWKRSQRERPADGDAHLETNQEKRAGPPEPRDLLLLIPADGGLSFRLFAFAGQEAAAAYIARLASPIDSKPRHVAFRALHSPVVPEGTTGPLEAVVLVRDAHRPGIVDLYSFVDMDSANAFLKQDGAHGRDLRHVLVYWAAPVQLALPDRPIAPPVDAAEQAPAPISIPLPPRVAAATPRRRQPARTSKPAADTRVRVHVNSAGAVFEPDEPVTPPEPPQTPAGTGVLAQIQAWGGWDRLAPLLVRAALANPVTYEEFDRDPFAAGRGRLIVALAAIAAVIGAANSGVTGALVHLPAFALGWCAFAFTVYSIGTQAFPGQRGKDTFQRLVRALALATTPALLVVLGVVPTYGPLFVLGAYIWVLLTATTAISAPLGLNKDSSIIVATVGCMVLFTVSQIAPILIV